MEKGAQKEDRPLHGGRLSLFGDVLKRHEIEHPMTCFLTGCLLGTPYSMWLMLFGTDEALLVGGFPLNWVVLVPGCLLYGLLLAYSLVILCLILIFPEKAIKDPVQRAAIYAGAFLSSQLAIVILADAAVDGAAWGWVVLLAVAQAWYLNQRRTHVPDTVIIFVPFVLAGAWATELLGPLFMVFLLGVPVWCAVTFCHVAVRLLRSDFPEPMHPWRRGVFWCLWATIYLAGLGIWWLRG